MSAPLSTLLIDLRPATERVALPLPGSLSLSLDRIEDGVHGLGADRAYLVVCARGTQADLAARYLRADGLEARAWQGSVAELAAQL